MVSNSSSQPVLQSFWQVESSLNSNTPAVFVIAICHVKAFENILPCFAIGAPPGVDLPDTLWLPIYPDDPHHQGGRPQ